MFFERPSAGFAETGDAGPAEFGRQRLKPPLTAAAYPAKLGRWGVIRMAPACGPGARALLSVPRWGFFHIRACGRHIQPNTVRATDGAVASPSACAGTALSSLISPGCVGAPHRRRFQTTTDVARTLLRTRHHFNKENSQSGFLLFEISSPSLKSAALGVIASSRQQPQQSTLLSRNDIQTRGDVFLRRLHSIYPLENPANFIRRR